MQFLNQPLFEALGWTLIHSLWQATLLAVLVFLGQQLLANAPARRRFDLAGLALLAQLILSLGTFMLYAQGSAATAFVDGTMINITLAQEVSSASTTFYWIPTLALLWTIGALVCSARLLNSYIFTRKLSNSGQRISESWSARCHSLARRLQIKKPIQLLSSALVQTPLTINHFKPLILFPIGLINQLNNEEIEAILAHELAHIRRNDFILNIFFSFIEALFYFHPAIWWISARMNDAREESCDELAIQLVGNRLQYARTLVRVQENALAVAQQNNWSTSMAFSGRKGHMQQRILRILNAQQNKHKKRDRLFAYLLVILVGSGLWISNLSATTPNEAISAHQSSEKCKDSCSSCAHHKQLTAPGSVNWGMRGEIPQLSFKQAKIPATPFQYYIDEINAWKKINSPNFQDQKITGNIDKIQNKDYVPLESFSQNKNRIITLTNKSSHPIRSGALIMPDELIFINTSPSDFHYPRAKINLLVKLDTLPSNGTYNYQKNDDGNRTEIKIKDGVIEKLILDGKRISPQEYVQYEDEVAEIMRQSPPPSSSDFPDMDDLQGFNNFDDLENFEFDNFSFNEDYKEALAKASEALAKQADKMEEIAEQLAAADLSKYSDMLNQYHEELEAAQEELQSTKEEQLLRAQDQLELSQEAMESAQDEMQLRQEEIKHEMQIRQEEMELQQEEMHIEMEQRQLELQEALEVQKEEFEAHSEWNENLRQEMINDGLIRKNQSLKMTFDKGKLKVNGKQIQGELLEKYKRILQEENGPQLNNGSKYQIQMN